MSDQRNDKKPERFDEVEEARRLLARSRAYADSIIRGSEDRATVHEVKRALTALELSDQDWLLLFAAGVFLRSHPGAAGAINVLHDLISDVRGEG